jgi:hypothetical protein
MNTPGPSLPVTYDVIVVRTDDSRFTIESGVPQKRAQALKAALQGFFREIVIVETPRPAKSSRPPGSD